jgi:tRNA (mo5U34)-methyltransferase
LNIRKNLYIRNLSRRYPLHGAALTAPEVLAGLPGAPVQLPIGGTMLCEPMTPLPTRADDPRLDNWYHTIELAPGLTTRAVFDHRPVVNRFGLPASLAGKTALDVGTGDGFWAFEMERRGADRVVAIDLSRLGDCDLLPSIRAAWPQARLDDASWPRRFATAHALRGSRVEYRFCSVYRLSPETVGTFDVVFCGSMLLHLHNPLQALINIRSVTRELAVIESAGIDDDLEAKFGDRSCPLVQFGVLDVEARPGENVTYWRLSTRALCHMLRYAGFSKVEPQGRFLLRPGLSVTSVVARV